MRARSERAQYELVREQLMSDELGALERCAEDQRGCRRSRERRPHLRRREGNHGVHCEDSTGPKVVRPLYIRAGAIARA